MRYIIYVPATLLPAVHHSSTRRRVITSFGPYSTLRTRVLWKSSSSCLTSNYPESCVVIRSIMIPVTGIVPVPLAARPPGQLRAGQDAMGWHRANSGKPLPDTPNPVDGSRSRRNPEDPQRLEKRWKIFHEFRRSDGRWSTRVRTVTRFLRTRFQLVSRFYAVITPASIPGNNR